MRQYIITWKRTHQQELCPYPNIIIRQTKKSTIHHKQCLQYTHIFISYFYLYPFMNSYFVKLPGKART